MSSSLRSNQTAVVIHSGYVYINSNHALGKSELFCFSPKMVRYYDVAMSTSGPYQTAVVGRRDNGYIYANFIFGNGKHAYNFHCRYNSYFMNVNRSTMCTLLAKCSREYQSTVVFVGYIISDCCFKISLICTNH